MIKRARKDYENMTSDPDTGNYYEFLSLRYRFKTWDGWTSLRRALKFRNMLEFRWYRHWHYKRTH